MLKQQKSLTEVIAEGKATEQIYRGRLIAMGCWLLKVKEE
jgi:hypothetical protein